MQDFGRVIGWEGRRVRVGGQQYRTVRSHKVISIKPDHNFSTPKLHGLQIHYKTRENIIHTYKDIIIQLTEIFF